MVKKVRCRAENPATCRHHGTPAKKPVVSVEPETKSAADIVDTALERLMKANKINAIVHKRKQKIEELENRFVFFNPPVEETFQPIPYNDARLHEYNALYERLEEKATQEEKDALHHYTGLGYNSLNEYLRAPAKFKEKFKTNKNYSQMVQHNQYTIKALDSLMDKAENPEHPQTVFRVLAQHDMDVDLVSGEEYAHQNGFIPGKTVTFKNYSSTSTDPGFVNRFVGDDEEHTAIVLVISTKKGIPVSRTATTKEEAVYTQDTEREILLPRDVSYKVRKVVRAEFQPKDNDPGTKPKHPVTVYLEEV